MKKAWVMGLWLVIVVMAIGTVSAGDELISISPDSQTILYDPDHVTYDIKVYKILNTSATHEIKATVTGWGSGSADDLRFRFTNETGASSGWLSSGESWNWGTPQTGRDENLSMDVKAVSGAPPNNAYLIEVKDKGGMIAGASESASGTTTGTSIPEFTTIAIPVGIALLSAMFFLNRAKGKREGESK